MVDKYMLIARQPPVLFDIQSAHPTTDLLAQKPVAPEVQQVQDKWGHFPIAYGNAALYLQTHNPRFRD